MRMRIALAAIAAASGAVFALVPAASAASTYTVSPGGNITAKNSGSLVFTDQTSSSKPQLSCTAFTGSGSTTAGSHAFVPATYGGSTTQSAAGKLTKESLTGCTNKTVGTVSVTPSSTWSLGISSTTSTVAKGYLFGVTAKVSAASGACSFTVSNGAVYGTYTDATATFTGTTTAGLTVSAVTGGSCALIGIRNGDKASLAGKVVLSPKQTIK